MKIMFIIHSLHKVGGAETVLTNLANHFSSKTKHQVVLTILTDKEIAFELDNNIIIERIINKNKHLNILYHIKNIKNNILQNQPDIIISFITNINIISTIAAKLTNTPIIISERSSYNYGISNKVWGLGRRAIYPLANTLVLPSNAEKNKYYYSKQIDIIPNPLKNLNLASIEQKREKIILAVGSLNFVKGFDMLIDAVNKANIPEWKLIILGEGVFRQELENQISKLNLNHRITLPGYTKDTTSYYKKASIFVLSSRSEGYPNVLCEAMSYGCAPIAFDCQTGPRDIIDHPYNGLLIESENVSKLSEAIVKLITDNSLRKNISNEARNISKKLDINHIVDMWEKSLNKVLNLKKNN